MNVLFGIRRAVVCALLVLCLVCACALAGCGGGEDLLAYQSRPMCLRVAYALGATPIEARLTLEGGGIDRDMRITLLAPADVAGMTITRASGVITVAEGGLSLPVAGLDAALLPLSLFSIPADAAVGDITRSADGSRTATLAQEDVVWTLTFPRGESLPSRITRTAGAHFFALDILEVFDAPEQE